MLWLPGDPLYSRRVGLGRRDFFCPDLPVFLCSQFGHVTASSICYFVPVGVYAVPVANQA